MKTAVFGGFPRLFADHVKWVFAVRAWLGQVSTIWWERDVKLLEKLLEFHYRILLDRAIICVAK